MYKRIGAPPDPSDTETDHAVIFEGYARFHKIINTRETMVGEGYLPNPTEFTPDFLMTVHRYIGSNRLITDAGSYRTKWLAPAKEEYVYIDPVRLPIELPRLCFVVQIALRSDSSLLNLVRLAAAFAINFLYIHPFSNSNGRVARLAVSWLLQGHMVVPVPLYGDREVYQDYMQGSALHSAGSSAVFS
ncbi:hypothetical protein BDK51DRAFT_32820 [Blyttiomyces helicus]|uniref:Fido domain-containing protein n=1 Tax=Blyttiomyces helicus TaxID=388810 RepID=A0A4P9WN07_9FUNG|nr:hypothetical protein BDK51DRAFT_32820 [Blyttiomyces helicus]|eukprot:RKO93882.1 hypothetical protein BDK51DRAFT_32820 [Blyttiomyces helicus]